VKSKLQAIFRLFYRSEVGQDLAEYCMLTAFLMLLAGAILFHVSGGMQNLWNTANTSLASGASAPTTAATASAPANVPGN